MSGDATSVDSHCLDKRGHAREQPSRENPGHLSEPADDPSAVSAWADIGRGVGDQAWARCRQGSDGICSLSV